MSSLKSVIIWAGYDILSLLHHTMPSPKPKMVSSLTWDMCSRYRMLIFLSNKIPTLKCHPTWGSWPSSLSYFPCHSSSFEVVIILFALQWHHNGRDDVSNHQRLGCLCNRLFGRRSRKTSKLRVTGLCEGNSPVTGVSPHKGPATRKMFPFDDVIMGTQCLKQLKNYHGVDFRFGVTLCFRISPINHSHLRFHTMDGEDEDFRRYSVNMLKYARTGPIPSRCWQHWASSPVPAHYDIFTGYYSTPGNGMALVMHRAINIDLQHHPRVWRRNIKRQNWYS